MIRRTKYYTLISLCKYWFHLQINQMLRWVQRCMETKAAAVTSQIWPVPLEHSHAFTYCLWCFYFTASELSIYDRNHLQNLKLFYYLNLYRKSLPVLADNFIFLSRYFIILSDNWHTFVAIYIVAIEKWIRIEANYNLLI